MTTNSFFDKFGERTTLLIGESKSEILAKSHILVVGIGGVGGTAVEMLVRAGVGNITIIDNSTVNNTNINRQLIAFTDTIGQEKTSLFKEKLLRINPDLNLNIINEFLTEYNIDDFLKEYHFDFIIDAIDTLSSKIALIEFCIKQNIKMVSSMGAGRKRNPAMVEIADISKSHGCKLAFMLRRKLHKIDIYKGFKVVFSSEKSLESSFKTTGKNELRNQRTIVGSISYMPIIFGSYCAYAAIDGVMGKDPES